MDKRPLIGVSICAVVVLVLASLNNVVGYQTVESSHQNLVKEEVNPKELVFQTILDIVNNKEIQSIILKYQLLRGEYPDGTTSVVTMKQLKQMYFIGLVLSKIISKSTIQSMKEKYQVNNPMIQKEINAVIQKDTSLSRELTQLSHSECGCENENSTEWVFPIICTILIPILLFAVFLWAAGGSWYWIEVVGDTAKAFNCVWSDILP